MLASSPVIKKTAKTALSGHFLNSVAISCVLIFIILIGYVLTSLVSIVAGDTVGIIFLAVFVIFAFAPLALGVLYFFRRLLWGQNDNILIIFKYFSNFEEYKRALRLIIILTAKLVSAAIVLFLPCIVVWMLSSEWFYSLFDLSLPIWTSSLWTLNSILAVIAALVLCFVMFKYYMAPFLFVSDDTIYPAEAVNMSTIISKRTSGDFLGLVLSFAGWIIISFFIAPLVFTIPYFVASYGVHCRFAVTAYNRDVDRFNSKNTPYYRVDEI